MGAFFVYVQCVCVSLHSNTFMLFGQWRDGYFFMLCHSPRSGAKTEQCVCVCVDPARLLPASLLIKCEKAWLALRNEAAPPTSSSLFFSTKLFFISHEVAPACWHRARFRSASVAFDVEAQSRRCCYLHLKPGLQAEWFPICRNTHILLLFEQKPNPEVCANVNASRSCAFSKCRGRNWFMAPVVVKWSSKTLISHSISHAWQELRMVPALKASVSKEWEKNHPEPQNLLHGRTSFYTRLQSPCLLISNLRVPHTPRIANSQTSNVFWVSEEKPLSDWEKRSVGAVNSQVNECPSFYSRYPSVRLGLLHQQWS